MTIAFISDLHLTPDRPHSTEMFTTFASGARKYLNGLYILGDLFEYWIGDDGVSALGHESTEAAIRSVVDSGVPVYFLHGNRDFLVGEQFAKRTGCQLLPDPVVVEEDGLRILLTHGDALCTDDIDHQTARKQMLTSKWKLAFLNNPLESRFETADQMRKQSAVAKKTKSMEIMDVNQSAVEAMMKEHQVDIMIHGHTHKPAAHEFEIDGKLARRYVLGDWYEQKSLILLDQGKLTLRR
ncbi:MAG: UDP-2,3-diacylglucosamine diphosphatase [Acidiferrobacterales bacterium]|nr:UDP-2,3-diacylglucosamine diphosphatase [Acidiferrobacterales bacterium]